MALVLKPGQGNSEPVVVDESNVDGLMQFSVFHIIKQSEAQFIYTGPKIPKAEWEKMLAFFKWTYDEFKSESQARLYVNRAANTWKIWVYPQEAKTGMSAREINDEEMRKQQAALGPEWMAFGTVHHHCNCSAFQSGTDEDNEKNQDGLHITIGDMGKEQYSLHARFYRKGRKFTEFPMTWFWDVTDEINDVPEWLWGMLQGDAKRGIGDKIAKFHMTCPPTPDITFPKQWKDNVKEIKNEITICGIPYFPSDNGNRGVKGRKKREKSNSQAISHSWSADNSPLWQRVAKAWDDIMGEAFMRQLASEDMQLCLDILNEEQNIESIMAFACYRHKVDPGDLKKHCPSKSDFDDHDRDLQAAGFMNGTLPAPKEVKALPAPPDAKTTTVSPQASTQRGVVTAAEAMGMTDEQWCEYMKRGCSMD